MSDGFHAPPLPDLRSVAGGSPIAPEVRLRPLSLHLVVRWSRWLNARQTAVAAGPLDRAAMRRILVVRLDRIGDVVMMSGFLRELRRGFPTAWVTLVASPAALNLLEACPYVNEVRVLPQPPAWLSQSLKQGLRLIRALQLGLGRLRGGGYDLAVAPRWDADSFASPLLCLLSGARWRVAYSERVNAEKARSNRGYDRFFTHTVDRRLCRHEVESNLDLLKCLGVEPAADQLEAWWTPEDAVRVEAVLHAAGLAGGERLVALAPGAAEANKIWPLSRFAEVGQWVRRAYGVRLVIIGGEAERAAADTLGQVLGPAAIRAAGLLTLRQTGALLKRCILFVGNDSGPMHLAAAAGIPVVAVSRCIRGGDPCRDQSPARFGPWGVPHRVLQPDQAAPPCGDRCLAPAPHCILEVSVPRVLTAIQALLGPPITHEAT
jgi:heptosyltransferase-2